MLQFPAHRVYLSATVTLLSVWGTGAKPMLLKKSMLQAVRFCRVVARKEDKRNLVGRALVRWGESLDGRKAQRVVDHN